MAKIRNSVQSLCLEGDWGCSMVHMNDNDVNLDNSNGRKGGNNDVKNDAVKVVGWDDLCSVSIFIRDLQLEIKEKVRIFKLKTLYDAYCVAIMQEATNDHLRGSCNKIVDSNSVVLDVNHCLENKDNKMLTNKEKHVVLQDIGKKEDCKAMDYDDKDVGYDVEDICEENVEGADMELDDNNCLGVIDKVCNKGGKGNALESNESSELEVNWVVIVNKPMKVEDKNKSEVSVDKFVHNDGKSKDIKDIWKWFKREKADNEVWKVIQNGNSKKRVTKGKDGVYRVLPPTTQEEQFADEKERKARTLLLMAVPKDHLRRFHGMDDAKEIRHPSRHIGLDALGAGVSDEDANHKFLRSLPPAWDSLAMTMRTKKNIDTLLKPTSKQHSAKHNSGTTNADDVDLIHEDLDQIDDLDLEEMDINWQIAMTAIKIKKSASLKVQKKVTGRKQSRLQMRNTSVLYMAFTVNNECCEMSSTVKLGLGHIIKSNAEVLGYEEEMSRGIFVLRETDAGYYDIPLYNRFKQVEYKGVPHPLSGDYTPRAQEDIDDSLYVYGKHDLNSESPSPTRGLNASSIVFSSVHLMTSDGSLELCLMQVPVSITPLNLSIQ
ncbi:hypothetical protein Tco_0397902 [Tanacetum coccineum]